MANYKKQIICNKHGKPIPPKDTTWQVGMKRSKIFIITGIITLPVGACLFYLLNLPNEIIGLSFLFGLQMFFGVLFLLFGSMIAAIAFAIKLKSPSYAEIKANAQKNGLLKFSHIISKRTKIRKGTKFYQYSIAYLDSDYNYTRRFISDWSTTSLEKGDSVGIYYLPDSNAGYYVDIKSDNN